MVARSVTAHSSRSSHLGSTESAGYVRSSLCLGFVLNDKGLKQHIRRSDQEYVGIVCWYSRGPLLDQNAPGLQRRFPGIENTLGAARTHRPTFAGGVASDVQAIYFAHLAFLTICSPRS